MAKIHYIKQHDQKNDHMKALWWLCNSALTRLFAIILDYVAQFRFSKIFSVIL